MKKFGGLFAATAAVSALGTYVLFDTLGRILVDRNFTTPEWLANAVSKSDGSLMEEKSEECKKWLEDYGYERFTMESDDGLKLRGYLVKPKNESKVYVFGAHGYRSDGKGEWAFYAKHYVEELGFNMFFVDHRAAGESEGRYIGFDYFEHKDCLKWLNFLNDTFGKDIQIILHGISMGSATVMMMTGSDELPENVKFTVSDCGYTSAYDEFSYKLEEMGVRRKNILKIANFFNKRKAGYDFEKDTNALKAVKNAKIPMLFVHGGVDKFVPTFMVYEVYENCSSEYKDILIVEGAEHAQSYLFGKEDYEKKIDEFVEKFIEK